MKEQAKVVGPRKKQFGDATNHPSDRFLWPVHVAWPAAQLCGHPKMRLWQSSKAEDSTLNPLRQELNPAR